MGLAITEDHRSLAAVARSLLTDRDALGAARAALDGKLDARPGFWADAVALGWTGLHVDERFGGQGYGLAELAVIVEELGRVVAPGPFLPTVLAAAVIAESGDDEQRERWLPALGGGDTTAAVGLAGSLRSTATPGAGIAVDGDAGPVLGAEQAGLLLLTVGDDLVVIERDASVTADARGSVDPVRPVAVVQCDASPVLGVLAGARDHAGRIARVLAAAEAVGGMQACLEMSVGYAGVREQFGRPIGSFQAVKHHCADMLVETELAAAATWDAARPVADAAEGALVAAVAAACALPAYQRIAELTIQVHGGIGYTWEHDAHLYLRRAAALSALFGPADDLRGEIAELRRAGVRRRETVELPPEAAAYRRAARAFRDECLATPDDGRQVVFARSGYLMPHWPPPYGRSAGPIEQLVIDEELAGLERPSLGLGEWILPTVLQHGTPEQLERWMWPSLEGELRWCQLFSEPGAGSDAAAVSTRAVRVDGGWSVTGQKVWTSQARECRRGMATVRTDPTVAKHAGITAMAMDLHAPGVEIRPLTEITGETLFNEVFFDDVFVPDADVIGDVNAGWRVARAALGNERVSIGGGAVTIGADALLSLLDRYRADDTGRRREVGALLAEGQALRMLNLRQAARAVEGAEPGIEGAIAKLFGAEHAQRVVQLGMRIAGTAALVGDEPVLVHDFFFTRCLTIAGGTSEVLRNTIAERILGLPREPAADATKGTR